ncbi:hypothetical protein Bca101_007396 [Brassica carinata]
MAGGLVRSLVLVLAVAICGAASLFHPISNSHRSAALDVLVPVDGSYKSLEEAYEALKTLEILGVDRKSDLKSATCENVVEVLASPSSTLKDAFYALSVNGIMRCKSGKDVPKNIVSKLQAGVKDAKLLLDFYYSVRGLVLVKEQFSGNDISFGDAEAIFLSIKALSQSDGKWRYSSNNPESSSFASDVGTFYFDGSEGPISTTASVIRGLTSFAAAESTRLNVKVSTVLGSKAPALNVKLAQALCSGSKGSVINNQILLDELAHEKVYITEAQTKVPIAATGAISIENAEISVLDSDVGSVESQKKIFLDWLRSKLYYLSGKYEIQLTIGDASMENSLLSNIGHIELDLPERPEKAPRPPLQPTDPYSRYGPKAEISHIFRVPEKLPAKQLSLVFLGLIVLPFIAFLIGLTRLGVNIKSFPSLVGAATSALLFHGGIGAVLLLYLDLFTTLKALSLLGVFLLFVGHSTLSHLASASNKLKSA